jgi:hypothetical protein
MDFLTHAIRGGFGFQAGMGSLVMGIAKTTKSFSELESITSAISDKEGEMEKVEKEIKDVSITSSMFDKTKSSKSPIQIEEDDKKKEELARRLLELQAELVSLKHTIKSLTENQELIKKSNPLTASSKMKGVFAGLAKIGGLVKKHALPISLGLGVGGIIMSVIVKALSASPLFAQMMKLMKFAVTLILMPLGTFFGAILRPILIMLLRKFIVPFYSTWMPKALIVGGQVGEILTWLLGRSDKQKTDDLFETEIGEGGVNEGAGKYAGVVDTTQVGHEGELDPEYQNPFDPEYFGEVWDNFWKRIGGAGGSLPEASGTLYDGNEVIKDHEGLPPYINPIEAGASTPLSPAQRDSQLMMSNPALWNQQNTFEKYRETGGIIEEVTKEIIPDMINPLSQLAGKITNKGISEKPVDTNAEWRKNNPKAGGIDPANYSQATKDLLARVAAWKDGGSNNIIGAAGGFDGIVTKPTMFMTGESGAEHITVTPSGSKSGGGIVINIQNMNGSDDDMRKLKKTILEVIQESSSSRGRI